MWPGARTPPTEPLNSVSPVNTSVPSTSSDSIPAVWPGVCSGSIVSAPVSIVSPGAIVPVAAGTRSRSSWWISTGVPGWRCEHRRDLDDVVVMVVREQDVGQRELAAPQAVEQRLDRAAGVDHDRVPARLVGDQIGVRQERVVHRALDDHPGSVLVSLRTMSLLHTCYRITDIDRSVAFYEALGFEESAPGTDPRRSDQRVHEPARRRAPSRALS